MIFISSETAYATFC